MKLLIVLALLAVTACALPVEDVEKKQEIKDDVLDVVDLADPNSVPRQKRFLVALSILGALLNSNPAVHSGTTYDDVDQDHHVDDQYDPHSYPQDHDHVYGHDHGDGHHHHVIVYDTHYE
ncbi:protein catecholamines up-like [Chironomus tepperi]|uniref:protein catecholamines up-like n=1 Tax=Chironomus tepperi TaxID=113505 RepID=UPI00391F6759